MNLIYTPLGNDGRTDVRRKPDEPPFAMLDAPKRTGTKKWGIIYRDGNAQSTLDLFKLPYNAMCKNRADAEYELEHTVKYASDYQLGLTNDYQKKG